MSTADVVTPTLRSSVALVTGREVTMRLRSKAFLISTGLLLLAVLASIVIGTLASAAPSSTPKVAALGIAADGIQGTGLKMVDVSGREQAERMLRAGDIDAIIVASDATAANPLGLTVLGYDTVPNGVVNAISQSPHVELLDPNAPNPLLRYFVALGFGLVFFMSAITFGSMIAQSVVEEKQTRIVELLLSAIPVRALLAGKVLGNSLLAFLQIVAIAVVALTALLVTGQKIVVAGLGPSVVWFVVFFVFGFVMLAALFAAAASLVSRAEDVGSVTSPITLLVMIPYLAVIIWGDNPVVLAVMSYVPFSATVGMPMRVFLGQAQWWEPLLSLGILLATTAVVLWIGERIYAGSLLKMGRRVKISEALAG
ncbi:ABC transporter permease [Rathayibacter sp. YIM 133350]|uniref:ABC transporter permease n=1 Tax=Rathayibacter sp. YIM 133350 TaxID=3131992 RepID=UPI00307EF742